MSLRKVVKHQNYELAVANLGEEYDRARQIIAGAEWSIRRSPDTDGIKDVNHDIWRARVSGPGFPSHFIYYVFDDLSIKFLTIKLCADDE